MPLDEDMSEDEFIEDIAPDVLAIIERDGFFAALDDVFCPSDGAIPPTVCAHSFEQSEKLLIGIGIEQEHVGDVLSVLRSRGACCDCEVLYNVSAENRLKSKYWQSKAGL